MKAFIKLNFETKTFFNLSKLATISMLVCNILILTSPAINAQESDHQSEMITESKGPHGGKILLHDDIAIELSIFEKGVPPEYRAWITDDGEPIKPNKAKLEIQLTRLGGEKSHFPFTFNGEYWLGKGVVTEPHSFDVRVSLQYQGKPYLWTYESYEGRAFIDEAIAKKGGIKTRIAGAGEINQSVSVYGKTATEHSKISHLKARFPGQVLDVKVDIGETVKANQVLAIIESNASLQRYQIRAPYDGIITERHANAGEQALEQSLFTLADYRQLWVELQIYPSQAEKVKLGQTVQLNSEFQKTTSSIQHLIPNTHGKPYLIAGAPIKNTDMQWMPGLTVKGEINVSSSQSLLVIDNRALQDFRDWKVVFIKVGNAYEIRPLTLGKSDKEFTEVLDGLNPGDEYVVENSYLIKADLEKSGASHDH